MKKYFLLLILAGIPFQTFCADIASNLQLFQNVGRLNTRLNNDFFLETLIFQDDSYHYNDDHYACQYDNTVIQLADCFVDNNLKINIVLYVLSPSTFDGSSIKIKDREKKRLFNNLKWLIMDLCQEFIDNDITYSKIKLIVKEVSSPFSDTGRREGVNLKDAETLFVYENNELKLY